MTQNENNNPYEIIISYPWIGSFAPRMMIHLNDIILDLEFLI